MYIFLKHLRAGVEQRMGYAIEIIPMKLGNIAVLENIIFSWQISHVTYNLSAKNGKLVIKPENR